jgi:hypothetical protein
MAIIQQGSFTSNGSVKTILVPAGVDWIRIINQTAAINNVARNYEFYFQDNMTNGLVWSKAAAAFGAVSVGQATAGWITPVVDSGVSYGQPLAVVTSISNVVSPVVTTNNATAANGLSVGAIVRFLNNATTGVLNHLQNLGGIDWVVGALTAGTSFTLGSILANNPGAANATTGSYLVVKFDQLFYPSTRVIVNMAAQGAGTRIWLNVPSLLTVGQSIRVNVPNNIWGSVQLNGVQGTITSITGDTATGGVFIDTDIPFGGTTAFHFATEAEFLASGPFSLATITPVGENTAAALNAVPAQNILADSMINTGFIGVVLGGATGVAATSGPAGINNDIIFYIAGTADAVTTT